MSAFQTRPQALAPTVATIPAELHARAQWVVWRYEQSATGKWTKIPYTPGTTRKAASTRPASWRSFAAAVTAYQQNPTGLDGIGYVFTEDDPYVGGDIDGCIVAGQICQDAQQLLPNTYAEISPSGNGIKFIARASGSYGRKTTRGELYSSKRFFTLTGNVLPGHAQISDCQAQVDAFAAALGAPGSKTPTEGTAGTGNRADLVQGNPTSDWAAARQLSRTELPRLTRRLHKAAGEDTQLAYLLRDDDAGFHQKWPFVGLCRADGARDDSMARAVAASGIKGRGFSFPEYVALMSHLYGAQALAKWGTKASWREELVALWQKAQSPRYAPQLTPKPKAATPRGRAANHAALVENVYQLLRDHRAGAEAIVQIADLATELGIHRRTVSAIIGELRRLDHVSTRRAGQYGGLIVTFSDVIYSPEQAVVSPVAMPESCIADTAPEETRVDPCVSSETCADDHSSEAPALADLAAHYLSTPAAVIGQRSVNADGVVTYRRTARHFVRLIVEQYGHWYTPEQAISAYKADQERRAALEQETWTRFFAHLRQMTNAELMAYISGRLRAEVAALAREQRVFDRHLYQARLKCAKQHLAWRGVAMPVRPTQPSSVALRRRSTAPKVLDESTLIQFDIFINATDIQISWKTNG